MNNLTDYKLRALVGDIMKPLKEYGKRRQRNPEWKTFITLCKKDVGDQSLDHQIVTIASEALEMAD